MWRWLGRIVIALVVIVVAVFAVAAWVYRDIPVETMVRKYGHPASKYVEIDGVRMHYVDEGEGPPVLLLHAHYSSLRMWEPWAQAMKGTHRVVRVDLTSHGLTRPDPTGDYSVDRGVQLLEKFTAAVGLQRFALAGASLGGTHAIRYAAKHPEQVERLILLNPGALEGREASKRADSGLARGMIRMLQYVTPRKIAEVITTSGFADKSRVPPGLIDEWWEFWRMEGQRKAEIERVLQYRPGDIEQVIASLRVPVLLMWGEANPIARFSQAAEMQALLRQAPSVRLVSYPGIGHMATYEAPDATARDALAYLDVPVESLLASAR
jgi:pimeloyl-ACP methyl ester carboxylesterase